MNLDGQWLRKDGREDESDMKGVLDVDCNVLVHEPFVCFAFNEFLNHPVSFAIRDSLRPRDNNGHTQLSHDG